jgi:hypothetical protein
VGGGRAERAPQTTRPIEAAGEPVVAFNQRDTAEQCPAGTLPVDDVDLCRLAELGRDIETVARNQSHSLAWMGRMQ